MMNGMEWIFVSLTTICQISPLKRLIAYDLKVKQMSNYISKTKTDKYLESWRTPFIHYCIYLFVYLLRNLQITLQGVCFVIDCWQCGTNFPFPEKGTLSSLWRVLQRLSVEIIEIRFLTKYRYIKHFTLNEYNDINLKLLCW